MTHCGRIAGLLITLSFGLILGANTAFAGNAGRASPPPLVLSPNLTDPWLLQLQPQRQHRRAANTHRRANQGWLRPRAAIRHQAGRQVQAPTRRQPQIASRFLPTIVAYNGSHRPGSIVIDTNQRFLYLVQRDGTARRYGVGVGKPGFEWAGTHKVTRKAEWPDWRPPAAMRKRRPELPAFMPGGPNNPLGARALYLGSTLYRIHGSNQPWTIGHAVSSGCIRMRNEDVKDLYQRVGVGTTVHVI